MRLQTLYQGPDYKLLSTSCFPELLRVLAPASDPDVFNSLKFERGRLSERLLREQRRIYPRFVKQCAEEKRVKITYGSGRLVGKAIPTTRYGPAFAGEVQIPPSRDPVRVAIAAHEFGHFDIGFSSRATVCKQELGAWIAGVTRLVRAKIIIDETAAQRIIDSISYAMSKAARRWIRSLPEPMSRFFSLGIEERAPTFVPLPGRIPRRDGELKVIVIDLEQ